MHPPNTAFLRHILRLRREIRRVRSQGPQAAAELGRTRLAALVDHARKHSPYYARLYRGLPDVVTDPAVLPVTRRGDLADNFDDWATDRAVTRAGVGEFISDLGNLGERYLGKYSLATTSGTTNRPGIYLADAQAMAVNQAFSAQVMSSWIGRTELARLLGGDTRLAVISATDGHFLSNAAGVRMRKGPFGQRVRVVTVHQPLPDIVAELNEFQPSILVGYSSILNLLSAQQESGRLRISPLLLQASGEHASPQTRQRLSRVFGASVRDRYGCSECPFLTLDCEHGWYHVNSDWVIAEPVDENHRPTPPGQPSHTVLLTNLANQTQPLLRYDLGDGVTVLPGRCECGNPLPALRVNGRVGETLRFTGDVAVTAVSIGSGLSHLVSLELFQVIQTDKDRLELRLQPDADNERLRGEVETRLRELLRRQGAEHVTVERSFSPPEISPGGKHRAVIPSRK